MYKISNKYIKRKKVTEDEMFGWHHQCNGRELGQTLEDGE